MYRQGDVLIVKREALPKGAAKVKPTNGQIVLAYGEATGHHHAIADKDAELFTTADRVDRWLKVGVKGATLTHQEHASVALPEGVYEIVCQREYTPAAIRRVVD